MKLLLTNAVYTYMFPGAGQAGQLGDLNAEKAYSAMAVHMQTVAGNEALVQYLNTKCGAGNGEARPVEAFGLYPRLIKTSIRSNFAGSGVFARFLEWVISFMSVTPEAYARRIVPLLFAPELAGQPGLMFNQAADAILPTPALQDVAHVDAFIAESHALISRGVAAELAPAS
ncbi:hypothetical protein COO60DRAFT_1639942 [Scenedesmus sp. NREL 46B-D3]|nr:hypothetical protein COO60DRAFT_1639942 [Scenedesmus sp. NREL 46B-D3]